MLCEVATYYQDLSETLCDAMIEIIDLSYVHKINKEVE